MTTALEGQLVPQPGSGCADFKFSLEVMGSYPLTARNRDEVGVTAGRVVLEDNSTKTGVSFFTLTQFHYYYPQVYRQRLSEGFPFLRFENQKVLK